MIDLKHYSHGRWFYRGLKLVQIIVVSYRWEENEELETGTKFYCPYCRWVGLMNSHDECQL